MAWALAGEIQEGTESYFQICVQNMVKEFVALLQSVEVITRLIIARMIDLVFTGQTYDIRHGILKLVQLLVLVLALVCQKIASIVFQRN